MPNLVSNVVVAHLGVVVVLGQHSNPLCVCACVLLVALLATTTTIYSAARLPSSDLNFLSSSLTPLHSLHLSSRHSRNHQTCALAQLQSNHLPSLHTLALFPLYPSRRHCFFFFPAITWLFQEFASTYSLRATIRSSTRYHPSSSLSTGHTPQNALQEKRNDSPVARYRRTFQDATYRVSPDRQSRRLCRSPPSDCRAYRRLLRVCYCPL
ncbi:hypothetical protein GGR52DRAFT_40688 [Hypoxylon sp. FL1284]|nr:hypothetical protein GGR52DRAFT_40688 [Hypoxylon sp. FL1284]